MLNRWRARRVMRRHPEQNGRGREMTVALSRRSLLGAASAGTTVALALGNAPALAAAKPAGKPLFGPAQGIAWLTYNENPYGPSPKAMAAMADAASKAAAAATHRASMVYLCNPNNPTAMLVDPQALRTLSSTLPAETVLLVDEAYNELTDHPRQNTMLDLVATGRNVIVSRTFSKIYGLAGLRIGYALSTPANAERINGNIMTIDLGTAALAAAIASLNDEAFMAFSKNRILEGKGMILDAARKAGLEVLPSQANFVFVRVPDADAVKARMADRGIIIRGAYGKWTQWSRVSTGKIEDVRRYAAA